MRYDKGHKATSRQRIIDVASRHFRTDGIAAVGLARVMTAAGLTNGAFYSHFASKEDLVREVLRDMPESRPEALMALSETGSGLEAAVRAYLSPRHRDNPDTGCQLAALAAEIARHPDETREAFGAKVARFTAAVANRLPAASDAERQRTATAIVGLIIGTLQIARATRDARVSEAVLESGIAGALALVSSQTAEKPAT